MTRLRTNRALDRTTGALILALATGCGANDDPGDTPAAPERPATATARDDGWRLQPPTGLVRAGQSARIAFVDAAGRPRTTLGDGALRQLVVRHGGEQSVLEPTRDGRDTLGVDVAVDARGAVLVAGEFERRDEAAVRVACAKTLFAVVGGDEPVPPASSAAVTQRVGLRLELAPMFDPLPLLPTDELPLRLRLDGISLEGVDVVASYTPLDGDAAEPVFHGKTDSVGSVVLTLPGAGSYLVHAEHATAASTDGAPATTFSTSLTFRLGGGPR